MQLAGHLAEPAQRGRGTPPGRAASSSSASSQPSTAPATNSCRIAERRARAGGPRTPYQPRERGDVREAARGEEAQQLELGVHARPRAGGRPSGSARRRRRPSVFDCSTPTARALAQLAAERGRGRPARNSSVALVRLRPSRRARISSTSSRASARVGERVVDDPAVGARDRPAPSRRPRPAAEEQLVELVRPRPGSGSRRARRRAAAPRRAASAVVEHVRVRDLAATSTPNQRWLADELEQRVLGEQSRCPRDGLLDHWPPPSAGTRRSPAGASVSRYGQLADRAGSACGRTSPRAP